MVPKKIRGFDKLSQGPLLEFYMPRKTLTLDASDFLPLAEWAGLRKDHRKALSERKKGRRLSVGPYATLYFENWDTMWYQVQEMLWIEKGGDAQLPDELAAYNPMIPNGSELSATLMFEISDEAKRAVVLGQLGGVEDYISISLGGDRVAAVSEADLDRTKANGKTSSVHFLHFPFTVAQIATFRDPATDVMLRIDHPNYGHAALVTGAVRDELGADFA
jgi:Protein of unknown function (DUF3501)